jgi:hypothetical protein
VTLYACEASLFRLAVCLALGARFASTLRMIENLRKDHDKSLKTTEDLRTNNSDLAKSLSVKDRRIQDLERALTE